MNRSTHRSASSPVTGSAPRPKARQGVPDGRVPPVHLPSGPLPGHDDGKDSARHYAAVGIVGLAALAIVGVGVGAYAFRPADTPPVAERLFGADDGSLLAIGVAADTPMLRPGFGAEGGDGITVFDGATGRSETVGGPDELSTADAAAFSGGEPAPLAR